MYAIVKRLAIVSTESISQLTYKIENTQKNEMVDLIIIMVNSWR